MKYITSFFIICLVLCATQVVAQENPIEVLADKELEWDRNNNSVTATGNAVVRQGNDLITAPKIRAQYLEKNGNMIIKSVIANPNAVLTRPEEKLQSQKLEGVFADGVLNTVTATGDVILTTDGEKLYSDKAVYNAQTRIITMTGNVRIEQQNNVLTGSSAEFNLNTNISRLVNDEQNGGRVKAVFGGSQ